MADDELSELLARALDEDAPASPPADRIAALRARAEARAAAAAATSPEPTPSPEPEPEPEPEPNSVRGRPPASRSRPWLAAAVVVALLAGFGASRLVSDRADDTIAGDVEFDGRMTGADGRTADADLTVVGTGIGRVIDLRTGVLPILPTGEYYQVWFVAADDAPGAPDRISAGTFHPDPGGRSDVRLAAAVNPALYPFVEITAEPGDGDPSPTGPVVLRAEITA